MEKLDFLLIRILAFTFVLLILFILALSIRLLAIIFPEKANDVYSAVMDSITKHYRKAYLNFRITMIEEPN